MIHLYENYYLTADTMQFILFQKTIAQKGKNAGKEVNANFTYYPTVELLLNHLFSKTIFQQFSKEDAMHLQEFKEQINELKKEFKKLSKRIGNIRHLNNKIISKTEEV